jgi:DNA-directed RNA polymerase subunit RPC12/RpoP
MDDYVQSMNEYFSLMKKAGFDEYTHEARELFDNSLAQIDRDAAITLVELRKEAEALKVENARLRDEEPTDDKNLFECFKNVIRENRPHYMSMYKSKSKINGELSEDFIYEHFRCLDCGSRISKERPGTKCLDHTCMGCGKKYQTKGEGKSLNALKNCIRMGQFRTIGSDYNTRLNSVRNRECDFICVFYQTKDGVADSLTGILHVPANKITEDHVIPCKRLKPPARRAGYQGCNILMTSFNIVHLE